MIRLQAIGNLGRDALLKQVNGRNVINFSVAHTERYRDSGGNQQERTTWLDCSYWTDRTAVAQYLKKGKQIYVEGTPDVRSFTRADGTSGTVLSLRVTQVHLIGGADGGGDSHESSGQSRTETSPAPGVASGTADSEVADDLPF